MEITIRPEATLATRNTTVRWDFEVSGIPLTTNPAGETSSDPLSIKLYILGPDPFGGIVEYIAGFFTVSTERFSGEITRYAPPETAIQRYAVFICAERVTWRPGEPPLPWIAPKPNGKSAGRIAAMTDRIETACAFADVTIVGSLLADTDVPRGTILAI